MVMMMMIVMMMIKNDDDDVNDYNDDVNDEEDEDGVEIQLYYHHHHHHHHHHHDHYHHHFHIFCCRCSTFQSCESDCPGETDVYFIGAVLYSVISHQVSIYLSIYYIPIHRSIHIHRSISSIFLPIYPSSHHIDLS